MPLGRNLPGRIGGVIEAKPRLGGGEHAGDHGGLACRCPAIPLLADGDKQRTGFIPIPLEVAGTALWQGRAINGPIEDQGAGGFVQPIQPLAIGRGQAFAQQGRHRLGRNRQHQITAAEGKGLALGGLRVGRALDPPAASCGLRLKGGDAIHPVAQPQVALGLGQGELELVAEHLHRTLEVEQPKGGLGHGQHRGAVEGCGAVGGFLGIELELQIQKTPQPQIPTAAAEVQQVGDGGPGEQAAGDGAQAQGPQQLAEVPGGTRRQDGILGGKGPIGLVDGAAELPKPLAAGEVLGAFELPALGITPEGNRWEAIAQIHHAARV